jgi:hypothetical protein
VTIINIRSIKDAVSKGSLIELASDYRTSGTARAFLSKNLSCAMSMEAYRQNVHGGTAVDRRSGVETVCAFLSKALGQDGNVSQSDFKFRFSGEGEKSQNDPLKLEWYAPEKYWVLLLPDEEIRPVFKPA